MKSDDLKRRTKTFALRIIRLVESLPPGTVANVIGRQLAKCGASVGLLVESELMRKERIEDLMDEADQLDSIFVSSINTARGSKRSGSNQSAIRNPQSAI